MSLAKDFVGTDTVIFQQMREGVMQKIARVDRRLQQSEDLAMPPLAIKGMVTCQKIPPKVQYS